MLTREDVEATLLNLRQFGDPSGDSGCYRAWYAGLSQAERNLVHDVLASWLRSSDDDRTPATQAPRFSGGDKPPHGPLSAKVYAGEGVLQVIFFAGDACRTSYADKQGKYQSQRGTSFARV